MCLIHLTLPSFVIYAYSCYNVVSFLYAKFLYSKSIEVFIEALLQVIVKTIGVIL
jgi:hypothetical protein